MYTKYFSEMEIGNISEQCIKACILCVLVIKLSINDSLDIFYTFRGYQHVCSPWKPGYGHYSVNDVLNISGDMTKILFSANGVNKMATILSIRWNLVGPISKIISSDIIISFMLVPENARFFHISLGLLSVTGDQIRDKNNQDTNVPRIDPAT